MVGKTQKLLWNYRLSRSSRKIPYFFSNKDCINYPVIKTILKLNQCHFIHVGMARMFDELGTEIALVCVIELELLNSLMLLKYKF